MRLLLRLKEKHILDLTKSTSLEHNEEIHTSTREKRKPSWMNNFICKVNFIAHKGNLGQNIGSTYTPHTYPFIPPTYFPLNHLNFVANLKEPNTFLEARNSPEWIKTIEEKIRALELNKIWDISELSKGKKLIGCK